MIDRQVGNTAFPHGQARFAWSSKARAALLRLAFCAFGCFLASWPSLARAAESPPVITSHSDLEFAVYKGDTIGLAVDATGTDLQYRWARAKTIFCRTAACEIGTNDWALGTGKVTLVVFNKQGSLYLRYKIRILAPPAGYQPGRVHPPMRAASEELETVTNVDLAVRTLTGRGFSYHRGKLQVVGPTPRSLDWSEKLRTQGESTLQIARDGKEQHILGFGTSVYLAKSETGRRVILLNKGTLRSRQLDGKEPYWSIVVGSWLQIDVDGLGDVLVDRPDAAKDVIRIAVLRGRARVFRRRAFEGGTAAGDPALGGIAGDAVALPVGSSVTITRDISEPLRIEQPSSKDFGPMVAATTPLYLPGGELFKEALETTVLGDKAPQKFEAAIALAEEAVARRDFVVAIEALKAFASDEINHNYRASLALGSAYRGFLQTAEATRFLGAAAKAHPDDAEPEFLLGEMMLGEGQWRAAYRHLDRADSLGYADRKTLLYYEGVASYYLNEFPTARARLIESAWLAGDDAVTESARSFFRKVRHDGWFELRLGLGALYDTNILRLSNDRQRPDGIKANRGAGYEGKAGFSLWGLKSDAGELGFHFDAAKTTWLEPTLRVIATTKEAIGFDFGLTSGVAPNGEPEFELGLGADAGTIVLGDHRALDLVGGTMRMSVPALWRLTLTGHSMLSVDPFPYHDDVIDPLLLEVVPASDRSNRELGYGVALTPVETAAFRLGVAAESGIVTMRNWLVAADSFAFNKETLTCSFDLEPRSTLAATLAVLQRNFPDAEDGRKDKDTDLSLSWTWRYSAGFYHVFDLTRETQSSTRSDGGFHKAIAAFRLNLNL